MKTRTEPWMKVKGPKLTKWQSRNLARAKSGVKNGTMMLYADGTVGPRTEKLAKTLASQEQIEAWLKRLLL